MTINEYLMEHNLTFNKTEVQLRSTGAVDFHSPSRGLIEKETDRHDEEIAIWEDAVDCARKLNFFLIAKEASYATGLHRTNACAALRITSAIGFHCHGETLETIGARIGKHKQVIGRYYIQFKEWSSANCIDQLQAYSPKTVIKICQRKTTPNSSLADVLDEFRQQLTDLFYELLNAAEQMETEVYLDKTLFKKTTSRPVDVYELLATN